MMIDTGGELQEKPVPRAPPQTSQGGANDLGSGVRGYVKPATSGEGTAGVIRFWKVEAYPDAPEPNDP